MKPTPPTTDEAPAAEPGVEPECTCAVMTRRGVEVRVLDPRCPVHGRRRHLRSVP